MVHWFPIFHKSRIMCFLNELISGGHMVFRKNSICFVTSSDVLAPASVSSGRAGPGRPLAALRRGLSTCERKSTFGRALGRRAVKARSLKRCWVTFPEVIPLYVPKTSKVEPRNHAVSLPLVTTTVPAANVTGSRTSHRRNL